MRGISLNNEGVILNNRGLYVQAIEKFQQAIRLKIGTYGLKSVHVCISLSGLADAYLHNKEFDKAANSANQMLLIGQAILNEEQVRIAREILADVVNHTRSL